MPEVHIDIVENHFEEDRAQQVLAAQIELVGGHLEIQSRASTGYERLLNETLRVGEEEISPLSEPERFFQALPAFFDGDYVFASSPHSSGSCPFAHTKAVPFKDVTLNAGSSHSPSHLKSLIHRLTKR